MNGLKTLTGLFISTVFMMTSCGIGVDTRQLTENRILMQGDYTRADMEFFDGFYSSIIKAIEEEDVDTSFGFYSDSFMDKPVSYLNGLRENTEKLYLRYRDILYDPENIIITVKSSEAVSTDEFRYSAVPEKSGSGSPLNYSGKERIYWKKEESGWKIVNWVNF